MRIEIRKSGDDEFEGLACPHCGATELVATKDGADLSVELVLLLEQELDERLGPLWGEFSTRIERERARLTDAVGAVAFKLADLEAQLAAFEGTVIAGVRDLPGETTAGWRLLKKRRQERLREQIEALIQGLHEETRRV